MKVTRLKFKIPRGRWKPRKFASCEFPRSARTGPKATEAVVGGGGDRSQLVELASKRSYDRPGMGGLAGRGIANNVSQSRNRVMARGRAPDILPAIKYLPRSGQVLVPGRVSGFFKINASLRPRRCLLKRRKRRKCSHVADAADR